MSGKDHQGYGIGVHREMCQVSAGSFKHILCRLYIYGSRISKQIHGLSLQDSKNLRGATSYNYILKPVASGVLILEVAVNEVIQFSPFAELNGATQMETKYANK